MSELTERNLAKVIAEHRYSERGVTQPIEEVDIEICMPMARAVLDHIESAGDIRYALRHEDSMDSYRSKGTAEKELEFERLAGRHPQMVKQTTVTTEWAPVRSRFPSHA